MDTTNNEVFENGYASGKADGFAEAWKLARGVFYEYSNGELRDMFGISDHCDIFRFPTEDVRQCFEEYKNRIKVGDVVKYGVYVGVVLEIHSKMIIILTKNSEGFVATRRVPKDQATKLAESVDSFSDMLGKVGYVNE